MVPAHRLSLVAACVLLASACMSEPEPLPATGCSPGATTPCSCADGAAVRMCRTDGSGYGACACASDGGTDLAEGSAPEDGGVQDGAGGAAGSAAAGGKGGAGGLAGAAGTAGGGGAAGEGGKAGTGGTSGGGAAGAGGIGEGGGGAGTCATSNPTTCQACVDDHCCPEWSACKADPTDQCMQDYQCMNYCAGPMVGCATSCGETDVLFMAWVSCVVASCEAECVY